MQRSCTKTIREPESYRRFKKMICEVRNNDKEVVLKKAEFSDVIAVIQIWLHKDKELCFSNPKSLEAWHED